MLTPRELPDKKIRRHTREVKFPRVPETSDPGMPNDKVGKKLVVSDPNSQTGSETASELVDARGDQGPNAECDPSKKLL